MGTYFDISSVKLIDNVDWTQRFRDRELSYWDDLRAPANAINPAGSPSAATVSTADASLQFAGNADNVVVVWFQLPHQWKEGSDLHPHIHWAKNTTDAGIVDW